MINFFLSWFLLHVLVILTMIHDNFWWVKTSPEYEQVKKKSFKNYIKYMIGYRAWAVIKDPKDEFPAIVSSLSLSLIIYGNFWGLVVLFLGVGGAMVVARYF
jgi:hypothetical protein